MNDIDKITIEKLTRVRDQANNCIELVRKGQLRWRHNLRVFRVGDFIVEEAPMTAGLNPGSLPESVSK